MSVAPPVHAQPVPTRVVHASRAIEAPVIDGHLDDDAWQTAEPVSGFWQRDPVEGEPASEETDVRVVYDTDALYIGARLHDRNASAIVRQLSRRDVAVEADAFVVYLDPHHDHLTGAQFGVSAAGVQRDALIYNDQFLDPTWDAGVVVKPEPVESGTGGEQDPEGEDSPVTDESGSGGPDASEPDAEESDGQLPRAGADLGLGLVALMLALLGAGGALVWRGRRGTL